MYIFLDEDVKKRHDMVNSSSKKVRVMRWRRRSKKSRVRRRLDDYEWDAVCWLLHSALSSTSGRWHKWGCAFDHESCVSYSWLKFVVSNAKAFVFRYRDWNWQKSSLLHWSYSFKSRKLQRKSTKCLMLASTHKTEKLIIAGCSRSREVVTPIGVASPTLAWTLARL